MIKYINKTIKAKLGKTRIVGKVLNESIRTDGVHEILVQTSDDGRTHTHLRVGGDYPWKVTIIEPPVELPTGRYALVVPPSDNQEDLPFVLDIDPYDGKLTWFFDGAAATAKTVKQALRDGWTVEYAGREEK